MTTIDPSGPSTIERSPSAGTSLTVMAERLVVGFDGKLDAKNAEEGPARMAVAITRDVAAGEGIVLLQDSNAECDLVWHYERTHMHHQHAHLALWPRDERL